jgi:fatty acid desaturase
MVARYQAYLFFPLLLLLHFVGYVTALFLVLSPLQAAVFVLIQQGLFGLYLGCSFAPNHKGMPTLTDAEELDFLRTQVLTSRNVRGSRLVDFLLGGLNYQIEHHLFPNMPRPNLRHAQPLVRAFCQEHDLPYSEATMFGSYAEAIRHLHSVGAPLRPAPTVGD